MVLSFLETLDRDIIRLNFYMIVQHHTPLLPLSTVLLVPQSTIMLQIHKQVL